ncbi:MAG: amidohydrolase family protein [Actinobacteria bacterium]|uniref:Unannotated protein n=1 Tax=freshwater metagenome TaxID=449393 RepID=A0A6J6PJ25_9ZZZZ|nr:amidohydrolase family protein [Actinomycetota bacterium]
MWITNAKIVDVVTGEIGKDAAVKVDKFGLISEITNSTQISIDKNEKIIDIDGRFLSPGLISCHAHLSVVFPFSLTDEHENPAITAFRAAQRAAEALKAGMTTIRCVHEQNQVDLALRNAAKVGWFESPRIFGAGRAISTPTGHGEGAGCSYAKDFDGFYKAAIGEFEAGADHIKIFITGGLAKAGESSDDAEMTDEEISGVVKAAREHDSYVVAHAGESKAIMQALRLGVTSFEHGYSLDGSTAEALAGAGAFLTPTLCVTRSESWMREKGFEEASIQNALAVSDRHLQSTKNAIKAGITLINGTDYPPGDMVDGIPAALHELFLMNKAGLSTIKSFQSITSNAALLLKQENFLGQIKPKFAGDFIATKGNPLEDLENLREIDLIIKSGKIIKEIA